MQRVQREVERDMKIRIDVNSTCTIKELAPTSTLRPLPPPVCRGCVSENVRSSDVTSFTRYVRSAFGCRPNTSGESI
jgi:hypothetical protein